MARPAILFYKKVTFSLPRMVIDLLEQKADDRKRSQFVAEAIKEKAEREEQEMDIAETFKNFRKNLQVKGKESSLEILRKFRYEIK